MIAVSSSHNIICQARVVVSSPKPKVKKKRERGIWTLGCLLNLKGKLQISGLVPFDSSLVIDFLIN